MKIKTQKQPTAFENAWLPCPYAPPPIPLPNNAREVPEEVHKAIYKVETPRVTTLFARTCERKTAEQGDWLCQAGATSLRMDSNLEQVIASALTAFPDFGNFDLQATLYDVPSPTSSASSDSSPVGSPMSFPATDAESSCSTPSSSPASSPLPSESSSDSSSSHQPRSKHRSRCRTPHCLKKEHVSIQRRNERERNRVKLVSDGFANLRKHVPTSPVNKKLSKVETLRTAIEYIKYLQRILNEGKKRDRERRLLQQAGWLQLSGFQRSPGSLADPMNSILMDLPEIAPHPHLPQATPGFGHNSVSLPAFQFQ